MRNKRIGLMGLAFYSANKGCSALSYSFLEILDQIARRKREKYDLYIFMNGRSTALLPQVQYDTLTYHLVPILSKKWLRFLVDMGIHKCDIIFDFTAGDSFSDIYGLDRFNERTQLKEKVIQAGVPLVLGSQTYGPFQAEFAQKRAAEVMKKAAQIFSRDEKSSDLVRELSGREPITTTDIAFMLPYQKQKRESKKKKIGINPSGLLWNGGYTQNNQFALSVDYQQYLRKLICQLSKSGEWEIHLISHVFTNNPMTLDNDQIASNILKKEFPDVILAPTYDLPMDMKSYISGMDLFIGARMHATIAAFSSGVAVIPFSYSRKFEGLYDTFNYNYLVSGTRDTTEDALNKTLQWIAEYPIIQEKVQACSTQINKLNKYMLSETEKIIEKF